MGIWVRVDPNFQEYVQSTAESFNHLYTAAYVLIAVGVIIMVIGFLGCCGAIRESQCMLSLVSIYTPNNKKDKIKNNAQKSISFTVY